jgi:lipopolysaccharide/colanic/teichoic acid biosynthesis glycosyltransferase
MDLETSSVINPVTKRSIPRWVIPLDNVSRRLIDILVSFFVMLFSWPGLILVATIIKRDTPGPVFYQSDRVGRHGKTFKILKFRTMYEQPESYNGSRLTVNGDSRVTKAGRWLRDTKLNELPQFLNVFLGHMTLVGPRPEDPELFADWPADYREKYIQVRPGMTSPASLMFFDEEEKISPSNTKADYLENILPFKLRIDLDYLQHRNIINDLDIIFLTFIALIPNIRKKRINRDVLDKGPLISFTYSFLNWFLIDLIISILTTSVSILIWRLSMPLDIGVGSALLFAFLIALGFSFTNLIFGLNRMVWRFARAEAVIDIGVSVGITTVVLGILAVFNLLPARIPLAILFLIAVLSFIGFVIVRYRERVLTGLATRWLSLRGKGGQKGERVIIIGAGEVGLKTSWYIQRGYLDNVFSIVGFVDDDIYKDELIIDGSPVLGKTADLPALIQQHRVDVIIFAIEKITTWRRKKILAKCETAGVKVIDFRSLVNASGFFNHQTPDQYPLTNPKALTDLLGELDELLRVNDVQGARKHLQEARSQLEQGRKNN